MIPSPVFFTTAEDSGFLQDFQNRILTDSRVKNPETFLNYPIVYIHYWPSQTITYIEKKSGEEKSFTKYDVYVGESIDLFCMAAGKMEPVGDCGRRCGKSVPLLEP